ncbi:MAG: hypothetical protein KKD07_10460 [Candidatus Omnitrophica bacterium]|nr:hypothetical protein [Candidatus Omnitrophota bacterium]MBU1996061.1 hypothetical protein [Candidatus Omnitrophota bacterium]MBU4334851.1 hypothetical protein [Candidatus Omnitrophota bacterium]
MSSFYVTLIFVVIGGVLLYFWKFPIKRKTREKYLQEMEKQLEGKCELMEGSGNSFKIDFTYDGNSYVYEDIEEKGLNESFYKAYVKAMKEDGLVLEFVEKQKRRTVKTDIFIASDVIDQEGEVSKDLELPKEFASFTVYSNDYLLAGQLLQDQKASNIFREFINKDPMGYYYVSLKMDKEAAVLEFASSAASNPNIYYLKSEPSSIEQYLGKLAYLVSKSKELQES